MAGRFERIDGFLGRLFFRAIGILCAAVAAVAVYAILWHFAHWNVDYSLIVVVMFGLVALAGASVVPYCFSRKRGLGEALDAMEGGAGDRQRPR
jgi:uncharacterized membrane protein